MFGDPISWIKVCLKLRFTSVDPMAEIVRARNAGAVSSEAESDFSESLAGA
jgi:hypothetical protein